MTSHSAIGQKKGRVVSVRHAFMPLAVLGGLLGLLSGCSTPPERSEGVIAQPSGELVPRVEPRSRYGNPASYVVRGRRYHTKDDSKGHIERGVASWYGPGFHGRKTSNGERYDMYAMTAAHKTLPLPTYARVTNLENGRSAVVRINDRGPFHGPRVIDLSRAAAAKLGVLASGTAEVEVRALDPMSPEPAASNPFLLAANKPQPQPQSPSKSKSQAPAFLDGFEPSGPAVSSRQALAAEQPSKGRQPLADTTGWLARSRAAPVEAKTATELVVAQAARPKPEAIRATRRSEPLPPREQADVRVAKATDTKGAKRKVDPTEAKPEQAKAAVEGGTKVAKAEPASSGMYLQVGAFGDRSNAENLRKRLSKDLARLQVQVRSIGGDSSQLYKVQVGPLASRAKASDVSQQLAALGVTKSHMVVD
jgi:rare lipoprotein A